MIYGDGKNWQATQQDKDGWFTWCVTNEEREMAEKQKIISENMRSLAITLVGTTTGDIPAFKTPVGTGRCNSKKIAEACGKAQLTPLCDSASYKNTGEC